MEYQMDQLAKSIALACVRNGFLEELHSGTIPGSKSEDYSDVKVVTPYGEIPWNELSRITDEEMKRLMKEVVNKLYTVLAKSENPEFMAALNKWGDRNTAQWDKPELLPNFVVAGK